MVAMSPRVEQMADIGITRISRLVLQLLSG
jgi:hypothetical protein